MISMSGRMARWAVEGLAPGCFSVVMATGIDSVGLKLESLTVMSGEALTIAGGV